MPKKTSAAAGWGSGIQNVGWLRKFGFANGLRRDERERESWAGLGLVGQRQATKVSMGQPHVQPELELGKSRHDRTTCNTKYGVWSMEYNLCIHVFTTSVPLLQNTGEK